MDDYLFRRSIVFILPLCYLIISAPNLTLSTNIGTPVACFFCKFKNNYYLKPPAVARIFTLTAMDVSFYCN